MKSGIMHLVRWYCSIVTREELNESVDIFLEVLDKKREDIKLKKDFKEKHPNYRKYTVDDTPPIIMGESKLEPIKDWRVLLDEYFLDKNKELKPVRRKAGSIPPPATCLCEHCNAPVEWLSINDGKKRSQVICKICKETSPVKRVHQSSDSKYACPHCDTTLYAWKSNEDRTIYKCGNRNCPERIKSIKKLNLLEKALLKTGMSSQFKLCYQWREYHYDVNSLRPVSPKGPSLRINHSLHTLGLVLSYVISYGMSARMTARILTEVHGIPLSYQSVLNWIQKAAPLAWKANEKFSGTIKDSQAAADETYIKILGKWHYTWFIIGTTSKAIFGFNVSDNRGEKPAISVINQSLDARDVNQSPLVLIGDGNPSYDAAVNAINVDKNGIPLSLDKRKVIRKTVIGLKNTDEESTKYRPFKNLVERLNRTYRYHTRNRSGFKDMNSAMALTTLFVTYYNFMRPHRSLKNNSPITIPELKDVKTIQGRWLKLLQLA